MGHDQLMLNAVFVFFVLLDVPANLNKSADCYGMIHDNASAADFCDNIALFIYESIVKEGKI